MPLYDYECGSCKHKFELNLKVADYNKPCEEPCPSCQGAPVARVVLGAGGLISAHNPASKVPSFFKDKMIELKKAHPLNTIQGDLC